LFADSPLGKVDDEAQEATVRHPLLGRGCRPPQHERLRDRQGVPCPLVAITEVQQETSPISSQRANPPKYLGTPRVRTPELQLSIFEKTMRQTKPISPTEGRNETPNKPARHSFNADPPENLAFAAYGFLITISRAFDPFFKVLFTFPSQYFCSIGLVTIFSFGWDQPPVLGLQSQTTRLTESRQTQRHACTGLSPSRAGRSSPLTCMERE